MELFDTHAHIYSQEFDSDRETVIDHAMKEGVKKIVLPAIDSTTHEAQMNLVSRFPDLFVNSMGLHPTSVNSNYNRELDVVEKYLAETKFSAIGEIGIDLYWDKTFFREQKDAFVRQVEWAKTLHIPVIIHTRDSFEETYSLLKPLAKGNLTGVFHCFSAGVEDAKKVCDIGFFIGVGGVVTFKNSSLKNVVKEVDINHIVLETDSPYLAPVPHRGKRNESSYLGLVAQEISRIKEIEVSEVAKRTTLNAKKLFKVQ